MIAMGDVHGCSPALHAIETAVAPESGDTLVVLGDFIDRGSDSKGVIDALLALDTRCQLIPILGNHEEMLLSVLKGQLPLVDWLAVGGLATLESYRPAESIAAGADSPVELKWVPAEHIAFLHRCRDYHETETHLLLHANYDPKLPLAEQDAATIRWLSLRDSVPGPHVSGKTAVVGHTPTRSGEIFDRGYLKCLDTWCYGGGWLTALDLASGQVWQADRSGRLRSDTTR